MASMDDDILAGRQKPTDQEAKALAASVLSQDEAKGKGKK